MISNKISTGFIGLAICLCLLGTSNMVFAQDVPLEPVEQMTVSNGTTRYYRIYEPSNYNGEAVPLMVDMHGMYGTPQTQANNTRYDLEAENGEPFIIVYPLGTTGVGWNAFRYSWNGGDGGDKYDGCCQPAQRNGVDDVLFIKELVTHIKNNSGYNIDPKRIYGSGFSNGSAFIQKMLVDEPGFFTAAFVSAQFLLELKDLDRENLPSLSVPIMLSHGRGDVTAPYDGKRQNSWSRLFPSAQENVELWRDLNGCNKTSDDYYKKENYNCIKYTGCNGGAEVVLCTVDSNKEENNHNHYGQKYKNADNETISHMGWEFVRKYKK